MTGVVGVEVVAAVVSGQEAGGMVGVVRGAILINNGITAAGGATNKNR